MPPGCTKFNMKSLTNKGIVWFLGAIASNEDDMRFVGKVLAVTIEVSP